MTEEKSPYGERLMDELISIFQERKAPEGVTCFSCVYCGGGQFSPNSYSARCVLGHCFGGCCKMVSEPCSFYEERKLQFG